MASGGRFTASAFSSDGCYFAHSGHDGALKILETNSGRETAIVNCTCTRVQWGPGRHLHGPHSPPKKKKRKKSDVESAVANLGLIALGTERGTIVLYSFTKASTHTVLDKGHTHEVTDIEWHTDINTLFSSSLDGHIVEWDISLSKVREKWKASSGGVHSLCHLGSNRLLTADHVIKLWDLSTKQLIQKFTGHATEVFRLLPVLKPSHDSEGSHSLSAYFLSAAKDDRIINTWCYDPNSVEKNAVTSFALTEEPADIKMSLASDQTLTLAVLTTKGKVQVFQHVLNGKLKKPLKPLTVVQAATSGSREEAAVPLPILAVLPNPTADCSNLTVAYGSLIRMNFEVVNITNSQPEIVLIRNQEKAAAKAEFSQVKTPEVTGATVLYPSHITPQGPGKQPGSKRKRKKSVSELTLEERLDAMSVHNSGASSGSNKPPKADQLVAQITQGLQSNDGKLLTNAFQERNAATISNTVKRLPLPVIPQLLQETVQRITGHAQSGLTMIRWLKEILIFHMGFLSTIPDLVDTLTELCEYINYRTHNLPKRAEQLGKLELLLAKVPSTSEVEQEPAANIQPLLVYQDESSDDEAVKEDETMTVDFDSSDSDSGVMSSQC